ncbi:MAG TPA: LuxR C-terminal-related transcriptional regulator, partial [Vicinamibacterales bacterium]|nr:LuxR C-terminal-related transcriptional regulator [Vicinamibacterales bacterium]
RPAEPGLALLWLARGDAEPAAAALRRCLDETPREDRLRRSELLGAYVDVLTASGDAARAKEAAAELEELASAIDALPIRALADRATGTALIASGDARAALAPLRRSWSAWTQIEAPYEAARVRALIGSACRSLGDDESAAMEFDAARWVFERLGAAPDLARLAAASGRPTNGLTPRECEVLALIAAGETNRGIAAALVISEHTVARHVQNMLQKLGFSSRASLAAFAVEQGMARRAG